MAYGVDEAPPSDVLDERDPEEERIREQRMEDALDDLLLKGDEE